MIALDTTALIDIFKENKDIKKVLEGLNGSFASTIINYQELMFGLDFSKSEHKLEEEFYDNFFNDIFLYNLDADSAKSASAIFSELEEKGFNIGRFDSMIAAILLKNNIKKIITRNVKHFSKIKGLEVIGY